MPLPTITTNKRRTDKQRAFLGGVAETYAERMNSEVEFIASKPRQSLARNYGSAERIPDRDVFLLEADVRAGRPLAQRREFAVAVMDYGHEEWSILYPNIKVVFTEHEGSQMMCYTHVESDWEARPN